jgi:hypothetical protein
VRQSNSRIAPLSVYKRINVGGNSNAYHHLLPFTILSESAKHFAFSGKFLAHPLTRHLLVGKKEGAGKKIYLYFSHLT